MKNIFIFFSFLFLIAVPSSSIEEVADGNEVVAVATNEEALANGLEEGIDGEENVYTEETNYDAQSYEAKEQEVTKAPFTIEVSEAHAISSNKEVEAFAKKAAKALESGLYETSLKLYLQALELDASNIDLLFNVGSLYHKLNNAQEAQKYYEKVLSFNNQHANTLVNYLALQAEKSPIQAMHKLHVIQNMNPSSPLLQAQLAMVYVKLGLHKKAKECFIKSLSLSPYSIIIRYNYATLLHNMGDLDNALEEYNILLSQMKYKTSFSDIKTELIIERMTNIYSKRKT